MRTRSKRIALGALAAAIAMTCACAKRHAKKAPSDAQTAPGRLPEPDIHGAEFASTPELRPAFFEFDGYHLGKEAREILKRNAEVIKNNRGWVVLAEGHCDERGTTEYNLALGQKRAKAVREYYLLLGIPGNRVATISYGEEKPACSESTEDCWARNRRAENKIKIGVAGGAGDSKH